MQLDELTPIASAAIPVSALVAHLRLGTGFVDDGAEDAVLETYLRAAISAVEARTGKAILQRRFQWTLQGWHRTDGQGLPLAPVQVIESFTLRDASGAATVIDAADYVLRKDSQRPTLAPRGGCLPAIAQNGAAEIIFEAGFGPDWADVPDDLRHAILVLAANYFDHRHGAAERAHEIPFGVMALLEPYRPVRLGGRA